MPFSSSGATGSAGSGLFSSSGTGLADCGSCSQQATSRGLRPRGTGPVVSGTSSGTSTEHRSMACRQRGWNAHPDGIDRRSGGDPAIPVIAFRSPCMGGNELSSP